jgi:hypothetical protein
MLSLDTFGTSSGNRSICYEQGGFVRYRDMALIPGCMESIFRWRSLGLDGNGGSGHDDRRFACCFLFIP